MKLDPLPSLTHERIHWLSLFLRLPPGGIEAAFPTEAKCKARLLRVRWPEGPICPTCMKKNFGYLKARKLYHCRECHAQFSLTSGTPLHRRRLDLRVYFAITAKLVISKTTLSISTGRIIKNDNRIAYATAVRLKKSISETLCEVDGGLLGRCICVGDLQVPQDIVVGSEDHRVWLEGEAQRGSW